MMLLYSLTEVQQLRTENQGLKQRLSAVEQTQAGMLYVSRLCASYILDICIHNNLKDTLKTEFVTTSDRYEMKNIFSRMLMFPRYLSQKHHN